MPDDRGPDCARWCLSVLYVSDRARCDQNQHEHNQQWQDCPREFYLVAAVDLRRLARFVSGPVSKADDGVDEQTGDDEEDSRADGDYQHRKLFDLLSRLR